MNKRNILFIQAILFSFLIFFLSCKDTSTDTGILEVSGLIEAVETEIRPQVSGRIIDIQVKEGQRVEKGQVLCLIDDKKIKIQIDQVHAGLEGHHRAHRHPTGKLRAFHRSCLLHLL